MKLFRTFSLFLCFLFALGTFSATKHALIIGIGNYEDGSWSKINGDRDVPLVKRMLKDFGYQNIVTLVNRQATKAGIISEFEKLRRRCRKGDIVYIHFSGHGQRMTDVNGDETDDGWDESWIPYDAYLTYGDHDRGEKHLSDDEIGEWMTKIREAVGHRGEIVVVVDACHSGDSSRDGDDVVVRGVIQNFVIPGNHTRRSYKIDEDWLTLSACKNFQRNCEILTPQGYYGMLTYALFQKSGQLRGKDNVGVMEVLSEFVDNHRGSLPQSPILTGNRKRYQVVSVFY